MQKEPDLEFETKLAGSVSRNKVLNIFLKIFPASQRGLCLFDVCIVQGE